MLRYTAADLLALRHSRPPERAVRKAIFSFRLWLPGRARLLADSLFVNIASAITSVHTNHVAGCLLPGLSRFSGLSELLSLRRYDVTMRKYDDRDIARPIPVVTCKRLRHQRPRTRPRRKRVLVRVVPSPTTERQSAGQSTNPAPTNSKSVPPLYTLNAAALSKPGAIEHLSADLKSYNIDVAVITETHFKQKHQDSIIGIEGYTVYRRDRTGRRGGGVAVYVR